MIHDQELYFQTGVENNGESLAQNTVEELGGREVRIQDASMKILLSEALWLTLLKAAECSMNISYFPLLSFFCFSFFGD